MWFISMNHIGTMFFVGGEPMICMHNCTDCKRKLSESGMQRVHVTSCNIRPSSTLARPLAQIYLCRDPNNTASRNTIALVHRSQLLEFRTGWPLWTCMSIRRCRSVRRNPVTITTTGTWAIVMPLAYDVASVRQPAATTAATCVDHRRRSGYQSSSVAAPRRDPVTNTKYRSR